MINAEDVKKLIYELFNEKYHNKYDVILFSPTITVGISIMNNVTHSFHYDEGKSVDTISSIQMKLRIIYINTIVSLRLYV